jgi:hypothetical protein
VVTRSAIIALLAIACSSSPSQDDGGADAATDADAGISNVAPLVVDNGPTGQSLNVLFTTITICVPGTATCQTIDHVEVDTGSTGLRLVSSVLDGSLALPAETASNGDAISECYAYADGFNWGPVVTADVQIGGEIASAVPIQIAGGKSGTIPSLCSSAGSEEDTVASLGGNGILGIGFQTADCGNACSNTSGPRTGAYYTCAGATCTVAAIPNSNQVQNPVSLFPQDNNGVAVQLPDIDPAGAPTATGLLIFGIGTAPNNDLGSAQVININSLDGYFTTTYGSQTLTSSFIDSGSVCYGFPDTTIPQCTGDETGFYCPTSTLDLTATNTGTNKVSVVTPFKVANATTLWNSKNAAFDNLAITAFAPGYFDWGLSFFFGRTVFTAISGASTPAGPGPYFAY